MFTVALWVLEKFNFDSLCVCYSYRRFDIKATLTLTLTLTKPIIPLPERTLLIDLFLQLFDYYQNVDAKTSTFS